MLNGKLYFFCADFFYLKKKKKMQLSKAFSNVALKTTFEINFTYVRKQFIGDFKTF